MLPASAKRLPAPSRKLGTLRTIRLRSCPSARSNTKVRICSSFRTTSLRATRRGRSTKRCSSSAVFANLTLASATVTDRTSATRPARRFWSIQTVLRVRTARRAVTVRAVRSRRIATRNAQARTGPQHGASARWKTSKRWRAKPCNARSAFSARENRKRCAFP